jgi:hypothetical protein
VTEARTLKPITVQDYKALSMLTPRVRTLFFGVSLLLFMITSSWGQSLTKEPQTKESQQGHVRDTLAPVISVKDTLPPVISMKNLTLVKRYKSAFKEVKSQIGPKEAQLMSKPKTKEALLKTIDGLMTQCPQCATLRKLKKQLKR